jgi:hypothetical protein
MEEEKDQKNLFEFEEPKKPFSKLASMLPKRDFEGKVALSLTPEKIVFIFIGIVMVMVTVFALGVESGRSRKTAPKAGPPQSNSGAAPIVTARPVAAVAAAKPYTIVAAAFSKKETAQAAVAFLAKEGLGASVVFSDPYYRVCVGSYSDMYGTQVQRDLAKVKRIYKDAFVRVR